MQFSVVSNTIAKKGREELGMHQFIDIDPVKKRVDRGTKIRDNKRNYYCVAVL